jgi:hypothetical protein
LENRSFQLLLSIIINHSWIKNCEIEQIIMNRVNLKYSAHDTHSAIKLELDLTGCCMGLEIKDICLILH